jgi:ribosome-associated protein
MELQKLQRVVVDALEDIKAQDIKVFNTVGQSDMFDRVVVATGNSNRQTRALAWHVVQKVKEAGGAVTNVEGTDSGEWVLVDLGDIIVHLMQPTIRQYYALEEMWGTKPVRIKLATDRRPSLAPSAATEKSTAKRRAGTARKAAEAAKKPAKAGAKKPTKTGAKTAAKSAPKSAARRSTAGNKAAAGKRTTERSAPRKTAAQRKPAAGRKVARKRTTLR